MSVLESALYARLISDSGVSGLVGSRVYPRYAPQNVLCPYLVYGEVVGVDKTCLFGVPYQEEIRFQIDCWSLTYSGVKAMKVAVKNALVGFMRCHDLITIDSYEPDTQLYREIIDFKLKGA